MFATCIKLKPALLRMHYDQIYKLYKSWVGRVVVAESRSGGCWLEAHAGAGVRRAACGVREMRERVQKECRAI